MGRRLGAKDAIVERYANFPMRTAAAARTLEATPTPTRIGDIMNAHITRRRLGACTRHTKSWAGNANAKGAVRH